MTILPIKLTTAILFTALSFFGYQHDAHADVSWGLTSGKLSTDMSPQQVINAAGYLPNKVEQETCGQQSAHGTWQCKKFTFGYDGNCLVVFFSSPENNNVWTVNNWIVEP